MSDQLRMQAAPMVGGSAPAVPVMKTSAVGTDSRVGLEEAMFVLDRLQEYQKR